MSTLSTVRLRAIEPEDLDFLYTIENDPELWEVSSTNVPYSRYVLYEYLAHQQADAYADHQVRFIIENLDGDLVGTADIVNFDSRNLRAELGLVILKEYRQKGYGLDAVRKICKYASSILHLHQLYLYVDVNNTACLSLFRRLNFDNSILLKDWLFDGKCFHDVILLRSFL